MNLGIFIAGLLIVVLIYALMTMALNLSYGQTGLIDFGLMAWVAIGAYAYALVTIPPPTPLQDSIIGLDLPFWAGLLAAVFVPALFAFLMGLPTLRLRGEYLAVAAYAFSMVVTNVFTNEKWLTNGVRGFYDLKLPFRDFFSTTGYQYFLLLLLALILLVLYFFLRSISLSPFGRSLKSIRENEDVALSIGKNLFQFRMKAYVLSAAILGLSGACYMWYTTVIVPSMFTETMTFTVWIALILGGVGNYRGAILGALLLIGAQELTRFFQASADIAHILAAFRHMAIGLLMVLVIRFRRKGLLPEQKILM
ncbi:MAG: branched-chain amino acid ABC transporter permease [Desulfohalobiaceae bacterium]|nr:branched-chain amino acid ABC transporter permease [Desulfohalobiaceae bacterium]